MDEQGYAARTVAWATGPGDPGFLPSTRRGPQDGTFYLVSILQPEVGRLPRERHNINSIVARSRVWPSKGS